MQKFKQLFKQLFLTKEGLLSWFVANIFTSLHWAIPVVIGFITKDTYWYTTAAALWALGLSPFVPLWVFNVIIAVWLMKTVFAKTIL